MEGRRGEVVKLGSLFEKYEKLLIPPQASVEKEVMKVISEVCGRTLSPGQVSYTVSTKTIYLKVPSILKSDILRSREEVLSRLRSALVRGPVDIR